VGYVYGAMLTTAVRLDLRDLRVMLDAAEGEEEQAA
jgi:hypothetical protein